MSVPCGDCTYMRATGPDGLCDRCRAQRAAERQEVAQRAIESYVRFEAASRTIQEASAKPSSPWACICEHHLLRRGISMAGCPVHDDVVSSFGSVPAGPIIIEGEFEEISAQDDERG